MHIRYQRSNMYHLLSLLCGLVVAVMVVFNGDFSNHYGLYTSLVFIHASGLLLITAVALLKRERPFKKMQKWYLYIGGVMGILTVLFNNFAYSRISVSSILALSLLGQSLSGLVVDQTGWMGVPRRPFNSYRIYSLILIIAGSIVMIDRFDLPAVILSLATGVNIVISRTINAKLAEKTSVYVSTFYNYLLGLLFTIPVLLILGTREPILAGNLAISPDIFIYLGGALGVCSVFICNLVVMKISAYYLTLLLFVGQIFSGVVIDAIIARSFSLRNTIGGILVAAGLCVDFLLERKKQKDAESGIT